MTKHFETVIADAAAVPSGWVLNIPQQL